MPQVTLIGPLKAIAGEGGPFEIDAHNIRSLLRAVAARFPDLSEAIEGGVAVAVDGQIFQDDWLAELKADSEVQILPPIAGG